MLGDGWGDSAAVRAWVQAVLGPPLDPGPVVGRDHLTAPQGAGVREARPAAGARRGSRPPSSPACSPIADGWATITARVRVKAARTLELRWQASTEGCAALPSHEAQGGFTPAGDRAQAN